jgi:hypothetical protein
VYYTVKVKTLSTVGSLLFFSHSPELPPQPPLVFVEVFGTEVFDPFSGPRIYFITMIHPHIVAPRAE